MLEFFKWPLVVLVTSLAVRLSKVSKLDNNPNNTRFAQEPSSPFQSLIYNNLKLSKLPVFIFMQPFGLSV
jgi:hypothetical protein